MNYLSSYGKISKGGYLFRQEYRRCVEKYQLPQIQCQGEE